MKRFVVGVDGSAPGKSALQFAAHLAVPTDAEVVALNCFSNPYSEMPIEEHHRLVAERASYLSEKWTKAGRDIGARVRPEVREGDPQHVLLTVADEEEADLVVIGRGGSGGDPGFLHLSSVVEYAAHHIARPLAVVPADANTTIERIVLGVDGSPESQAAVRWCADSVTPSGAEVLAVGVFAPALGDAAQTAQWHADHEQQVIAWTQPLLDAGARAEPVVCGELHPAQALIEVASSRGAQLLVVGTRRVGGISGLRAGGVAMALLHGAHTTLLLVPPRR